MRKNTASPIVPQPEQGACGLTGKERTWLHTTPTLKPDRNASPGTSVMCRDLCFSLLFSASLLLVARIETINQLL